MDRLHKQLQYFVVNKMSSDKLWEGVTVYLSGHEVGLAIVECCGGVLARVTS